MYTFSITVEDELWHHIKDAKVPKEAWDTLAELFICTDISKLDPKNKIDDSRVRRIIIHGLKLEYATLVTATRGWAKEPTLTELENLLANQEALKKQISGVTFKDEEKALFSNKKKNFKEKFKNGEVKQRKIKEIGRKVAKTKAFNKGEQNGALTITMNEKTKGTTKGMMNATIMAKKIILLGLLAKEGRRQCCGINFKWQ
ncbi:hypothetical protein GH714_008311 [Hevea brasiliensis]|uniref:Uncharacterized protein n=1 Tax=Hevea brasiliensis TaxID=3981 RepID=A0A6A6NCF7_HEVBR|nr:hypothetical protein GH714_008311 [Hevea brasiliensis]